MGRCRHPGCRPSERFQSTHPVRGGTRAIGKTMLTQKFQSTHPVRGGTRAIGKTMLTQKFQSTHPVRGGTCSDRSRLWIRSISIHPPRAGWDSGYAAEYLRNDHFNPPTPCGVGRSSIGFPRRRSKFQSTHPVRGGTCRRAEGCALRWISIHPPRAGWDLRGRRPVDQLRNFNPPTPCGVGRGS